MQGPLSDVTVLDLTRAIAGPYATKLLADFGADVIKIEPPEGDPARRLGPFPQGLAHPERSGTFFYLNTNKRSVVLDLHEERGRNEVVRLLDTVDVVVESFPPGHMERLGLGWDVIHQRRPSLPLVSISNFGQTGPYRDFKGTELTLYAYGGELYTMGISEREPVKMYGTAALIESGAAASTAILAALMVGKEQGIGQHVDFSIAESHILGVDRRHATLIATEFSGRKSLREESGGSPFMAGVYPCADGYVEFSGASGRIDRLAEMLGDPEWFRDAKWRQPGLAYMPDLVEEYNGHFYAWLMDRTKREVWTEARRAKVLCGPLFSVADLFEDSHFRDRGFWTSVNHPELGAVELPGRPLIMSESAWEIRRPAPLLGQHTDEVLAELEHRQFAGASPSLLTAGSQRALDQASIAAAPNSDGSSAAPLAHGAPPPRTAAPLQGPEDEPEVSSGRLPLEGVRVLDFCVVWAGPFASMLLADLGAEVIKVENPHVWQPMTRGAMARPPKALLAAAGAWGGGYPNGEPGQRPWNYCPTFVQLYRNKKSVTMDLRRPEGMEMFKRLVAKSDVLIENNATETLPKLGITYEWLRQQREDIIMLRAPAYGSSGPYEQTRALGVHLESVMGHTLLRGYRDLEPTSTTAIYSGDYLTGAQGALAVMMALWHRKKTGLGQLIEIGQAENAAALLAQAFMDYSLNRNVQTRLGNRSLYGFAPCGVYPCRSAGTAQDGGDRWIAITVIDDTEWQSLRQIMGDPQWAQASRFASAGGRAAEQDLLDAKLADWTRDFDDYDLFHRLQAAGIAAAPVLEASRVFDDPQVLARRLFQPQVMDGQVGPYRFDTPFYRFPVTPATVYQPPVALGEHNEYVYKQILNVSESEYEQLRLQGHIAMDYDPSIR